MVILNANLRIINSQTYDLIRQTTVSSTYTQIKIVIRPINTNLTKIEDPKSKKKKLKITASSNLCLVYKKKRIVFRKIHTFDNKK